MNSISESFKSHPLHLNHIISLDFNSLPKVPDSHTWTLPKSIHNPLPTESIPIIDLLGDSKNTNELIQQAQQKIVACEKWGAFQIINHGVPITLLHQIEHQTWRLFTLLAKQKLRAMRLPDGLTGYGVARIAPFFPKLMWSEVFPAVGSPEEHARQLWPHDYTTFCYVMEDYQKEMKALSEIIMVDATSGLQVLHGNSGWVTVPPLTGALVINIGDLMHILSNGRFKTTLHRAVVNKAEHRISVAYFFSPSRDAKISPLIKLTDHDHPPFYRPVTWKEYLGVKATYFNKAFDLIRFDTFSTM
ncbi:hypothetical protein ACSBR1_039276 [Camellia fascicularis]